MLPDNHRYTNTVSASQNETAVRNLRLGLFLPTLFSLLLRLLFRRSSLPPSKTALAVYIIFSAPGLLLSNYLVKSGTTRRDPTTKAIISSGEDLNQPGITEWCFDIIYITCELPVPLVNEIRADLRAQTCVSLEVELSGNVSGGSTQL